MEKGTSLPKEYLAVGSIERKMLAFAVVGYILLFLYFGLVPWRFGYYKTEEAWLLQHTPVSISVCANLVTVIALVVGFILIPKRSEGSLNTGRRFLVFSGMAFIFPILFSISVLTLDKIPEPGKTVFEIAYGILVIWSLALRLRGPFRIL